MESRNPYPFDFAQGRMPPQKRGDKKGAFPILTSHMTSYILGLGDHVGEFVAVAAGQGAF